MYIYIYIIYIIYIYITYIQGRRERRDRRGASPPHFVEQNFFSLVKSENIKFLYVNNI